jgi:hypothetical protein
MEGHLQRQSAHALKTRNCLTQAGGVESCVNSCARACLLFMFLYDASRFCNVKCKPLVNVHVDISITNIV